MKKFKHKTTGYIATETNSEKNYKVSEPKNFTIPKWIVENSEDWEEVKEFPKIISLQHINTLKIITDKASIDAWLEGYDTRFWQIYQVAVSESEIFTLGDKVTYNYKANYAPWMINNFFIRSDGKILARSKNNSICEIVLEIKKVPEPLLVTEDGVDVYDGDKVYLVTSGFTIIFSLYDCNWRCGKNSVYDSNKYFSTKEAAEDWLAKNKPKDLQYYENLLLNNNTGYSEYSVPRYKIWYNLKTYEPRLFYLKVLELIQQDLDEGWKPNWNDEDQDRYFIENIDNEITIGFTNALNRGQQMFKTRESAQKAIELLKDKLDIIFK